MNQATIPIMNNEESTPLTPSPEDIQLANRLNLVPDIYYERDSKVLRPLKNGMRPIHPGEIISEFMDPDMSVYDFAKSLDYGVKRLKRILKGKELPSDLKLYSALSKKHDTTLQFFVNIHNSYITRKIEKGSEWGFDKYKLDDVLRRINDEEVEWVNIKPVGLEVVY